MKKLIPIVLVLVAIGAGGRRLLHQARRDRAAGHDAAGDARRRHRSGRRHRHAAGRRPPSQVGTQVSGIVQELYADFNSIVKKGQVIARLDPSILQTQVETAQANLVNAQANLERQKAAVDDAKTQARRAPRSSPRDS